MLLNRLISIGLLFFYLTAAFELAQWAKIPDFVRHYMEHRHNNGSENLRDFLIQHYIDKHQEEDTKDEHNKLPFKDYHSAASVLVAFLQEPESTDCAPLFSLSDKITDYNLPHFLPSGLFFDIWQPPKITV